MASPAAAASSSRPADAIAEEMVRGHRSAISAQPPRADALLLVNGFGGTPLMELYLMYNSRAAASSRSTASTVARSLVGTYVTSLDMAGCSITVTMLDDEMARLWDAPVHTAALRWGM